jgi:hypothetical protein
MRQITEDWWDFPEYSKIDVLEWANPLHREKIINAVWDRETQVQPTHQDNSFTIYGEEEALLIKVNTPMLVFLFHVYGYLFRT